MRILKLLNKKILSIILIFLLSPFYLVAEEQPIDIWNIQKKEIEIKSDAELSKEKIDVKVESSIYDMQADKKKEHLENLKGKVLEIAGEYDTDFWIGKIAMPDPEMSEKESDSDGEESPKKPRKKKNYLQLEISKLN